MSTDQGFRVGLRADPESAVPDARLVAALEDTEPAGLTGEQLAAYVRACARAHNRSTARLLEGLHHLGRAEAGRTDRRAGLDEFSGDEVATALGWSRAMAARKLDLADDLQGRLTEVGDALYEGWLDEPQGPDVLRLDPRPRRRPRPPRVRGRAPRGRRSCRSAP